VETTKKERLALVALHENTVRQQKSQFDNQLEAEKAARRREVEEHTSRIAELEGLIESSKVTKPFHEFSQTALFAQPGECSYNWTPCSSSTHISSKSTANR